MIDWLIWIIGIILLIFSIIDWRVKAIPSIFLTAMLFAIICLFPQNIYFGIIGFVIAYLLFEAEFFNGIADIKILTMISFMISTTTWMFVFILLTVFFGFVWKVLIRWRLPKERNTAFVPVFLFCYLVLIWVGGIT